MPRPHHERAVAPPLPVRHDAGDVRHPARLHPAHQNGEADGRVLHHSARMPDVHARPPRAVPHTACGCVRRAHPARQSPRVAVRGPRPCVHQSGPRVRRPALRHVPCVLCAQPVSALTRLQPMRPGVHRRDVHGRVCPFPPDAPRQPYAAAASSPPAENGCAHHDAVPASPPAHPGRQVSSMRAVCATRCPAHRSGLPVPATARHRTRPHHLPTRGCGVSDLPCPSLSPSRRNRPTRMIACRRPAPYALLQASCSCGPVSLGEITTHE